MAGRRTIAALLVLACTAAGCATHPTACRVGIVAGTAVVGAAVGVVVADGTDPSNNKETQVMLAGGIAGAVVGALLGILPATFACPEAAPVAPVPPPAPPPSPPASAPSPPPAVQ